jgi:DNA-binding FadR family transcriptional regulator
VATEGMRLDTINEHIVIVDAVKAGNGEAAREALEEHLEAASERGRILVQVRNIGNRIGSKHG